MSTPEDMDVIVAGSGNAAMSAALTAAQEGARVVVLEKAAPEEAGGNTWYTAGAYRVPHGGLEDLRPLLRRPLDPRTEGTQLPAYEEADFRGDLERLTDGRCDPEMADVLVADARAAIEWLHRLGVEFELMYHRQAYALDGGGHRFWGNLALGVVDGGKGLVGRQHAVARVHGVEIVYGAAVDTLETDEHGDVVGVATADGRRWRAPAVVLACGGFQADPQMRAEHLGEGWLAAKVRGTRHNTGEALRAALAAGAGRAGDWSTCHSVAWDAGTPAHGGDRELTNRFTKQSYPLGIVVNVDGERFVDEGADFRNYTYARLGAAIIDQPGARAFQLFDAKTIPLLREDEYTVPGVARYEAQDLRALAEQAGIDPDGLERTVREFNASVQDHPFDPTEKDGKATQGITPPKSNWAQPLDRPPFLAVAVTCGITFTFGGLRIDVDGRALDDAGRPVRGLFAAGEIAGGLFAGNYPGGSGLTAGTVFGRRAGASAAAAALQPDPAPSAVGVQQEGVAP